MATQKVGFVSLGCPKALVDSERILTQLRIDGYEIVPSYQNADIVVCREVLEHIPVREWGAFVRDLFRVARQRVYLTTRFTPAPAHPFDLTDEVEADPSHITVLPQPFVRALCVVQGGHRDTVWENALDWQHKGRVLVYEVPR